MKTTTKQSQTIESKELASKAMLVRLSISMWAARKHDKKASKEIADKHQAKQDAGRYNKALIAKESLQKLQSISNEIRIFHYANTLPWSDEGMRILTSANFSKYSEKIRSLKSDFENATREFVQGYNTYVEDSKERLGSLFNEMDYPKEDEIKEKFDVTTAIYPLPTSNDFRVKLRAEDASIIKKNIEEGLIQAQAVAMKDLWQRLYDSVSHMSERLNDPEKIFKNSMISNIAELCSLLPRLNLSNDPNLEEMRKDVEQKLCSFDPEDLRKNKKTRKQTAKTADDLLSAMSGYLGGK
ncbi:hypothetical protein A2619_01145 [candidate division WWE3 bacterium RIFOXYD1_FULL_39_9]|uniref:DUF3150 domain-containing protein n=1 Tax=candidate division WWE3 bacterium RIFOXYD1_FULL_39_9 TaxID=1802649 RepID=A0A1F4X6A0_UNCKA|nr:MAG: hypothetical protein A2619_01145 [candidate division WWE3 bacterium RIFOXYD1_FULL_39_9]